MTRAPLAAPTREIQAQRLRIPYPQVRVIVLDDDVNTFEHVVRVLVRIIPGMDADHAWRLAYQIDGEGSAVVWSGPLEQGELYHQQLTSAGLTMAPLETA
jgi:ATP-dependent Clp protease adaptor protein ClpS